MAQLRQRINQVQQKVELKSERSDSGEGQQIATLTQQVAGLTKTVEQLTKLVTDVLTGQRLQRKTGRSRNCLNCGQPSHYKSKCPLRVKNFTPAADTGILVDDVQKENNCCLDEDHGTLKVDKKFLLRTEGTGSCCQAGVSDSRKGVCVPGLTDEVKIADEDQGKEGCLVPLKEELQKEITKTQREANHRSLLTKSDLVIRSSEDLGRTTLLEPAGDHPPSKQPPWASPTDKNEMDWVWTWMI